MPKFSEYVYEEPKIEEIEERGRKLIQELREAKTPAKVYKIIDKMTEERIKIDTAATLASIRFTINTADEYYAKQQDLMDELSPRFEAIVNEFYKALLESPFKNQINRHYGPVLLSKAEVALKSFDPKIIDDLVEDNKLSSRYSKLLASAKIRFQGKTYNLAGLGQFTTSPDRKIRSAATKAYFNWFAKNQAELDEIYDKLVHLRDGMAKKMGYKNYVELGYLRLGRVDYNAEDVKNYRDQVYKDLVPLTKKLFRQQAKRLGIRGMKWFDYNLDFNSGNAKPIGDKDYLVNEAKKMYEKISPETGEYFNYMINNELLDLETKPNKAGGGYCTFIAGYKSPFIFSNFNGTSGDVDVLTHEAGHAFMAYRCRDSKLLETIWPTMEACEIHSMSMEFMAYPYVEAFFKDAADKYRFSHLTDAITFIPYGVAVDEFQEYVYENPDVTPSERNAKWREIEQKYLPHLKYGKNEYLNNGGRWQRQHHIYELPFYYIDYTIAQVLAFEFFNLDRENHEDAWKRYLALCDLGGSKTFLNLLKDKNVRLVSPFKKGCIKKVVKPLKEYLAQFDDTKM